ncbi:hypothetical protein PG990_002790 [Apiospora arundinis]
MAIQLILDQPDAGFQSRDSPFNVYNCIMGGCNSRQTQPIHCKLQSRACLADTRRKLLNLWSIEGITQFCGLIFESRSPGAHIRVGELRHEAFQGIEAVLAEPFGRPLDDIDGVGENVVLLPGPAQLPAPALYGIEITADAAGDFEAERNKASDRSC